MPQVPPTIGPVGHDRSSTIERNVPLPHGTHRCGPSQRSRGTCDMAGPAPRGSRGHGRSARHVSSRPRHAVGSTVGRGSVGTAPPSLPAKDPARTAADQLVTRSTYRQLLMKGLAPDEAANLTAFLCGIPVSDVHWSLRQVNQLLFLRELARKGRFGPADGEATRPH